MLAAERGAAANTLAAYRRDLDGAEELIGDLVQRRPRRRSRGSGQGWAALAPSTVARKASALRQFYGFLLDEGLREDDPSPALPRPAPRRPLPKILSHGEVEALFARAELEADSDLPAAVRLLTLIELLYGSGLRATELVALPLAAVPRDAPFLTVTGKGSQQRMVPVSTRARQALSRWLDGAPGRRPLPVPLARQASDPRTPVPAASRSWPRAPGSTRPRSARTSCAMPSPPICSRAGRTCACCRRCSAMPTSPPRRSTPTSMPRGWSRWSTSGIPLRAAAARRLARAR